MANYDLRTPIDYEFAQLSAGISSLDTTLSSAGFTNLPSTLSTTQYVPITLADDSAGIYETVWVTGHAANSTSVTVIRGREGTTSRAWASGTTYRCGPTIRDTLPLLTRATLPADAHIGMRAVLSDESVAVEKTALGWVSQFGGAARRNLWNSSSISLASDTDTVVTGLAAATGFQTGPATYSAGDVTLNTGGLWHLRFGVFRDYGVTNWWMNTWMRWVSGNGAWPGDEVMRTFAFSGYPGSGAIQRTQEWTGYVTPAQAATPIRLFAHQVAATPATVTGIYVQFTAELIGG